MPNSQRLELTRDQVLAFRRRAGWLDERLPPRRSSLRTAAWAGLQDSMPRAALLSIHARVEGAHPAIWEDPALVQTWGPRFNVYVVPKKDLGVFTLGTMPHHKRGRERAERLAAQLRDLTQGKRWPHEAVGAAFGVNPNMFRYAAATGTVLIRWDGARQATIWTVPPPAIDPHEALLELARRYLHVYGPATPKSFGVWSNIGPRPAASTFEALGPALLPVETPIGESWLLVADELEMRKPPTPPAPARLLPSGDAYFLLQGAERQLLVPEDGFRQRLWTSRVWPGAVLAGGEIVGTWRRAGTKVNVEAWRALSRAEQDAVTAEAESLPIPGATGRISVQWT